MAPQPPNPGGKPHDASRKRKDAPQGSGSSNPNPGRNEHFNGNGGRSNKRVKFRDARSLRSQPADAALKDGELDLQAFLNAREYEIKALTDGMSKSKASNNRRAFQLVPRSMRRRTASHNVKKLPKRLRTRARREQVEDNTPNVEARRRKPKTTRARIRLDTAKRLGVLAEKKRKRKLREAREKLKEGGGDGAKKDEVSTAMKQLIETRPARPKIRRNVLNDPPKPKPKFRKRQIDKTWLPTHLWHVKRAKMTPPKDPLWRFAIPLTPTEKVYRPTHRASTVRGAIAWDVSYMSTIGLYGHEAGVARTLKSLGLSHDSIWDHRGQKWREGRRKWSGILNKQTGDGRRNIGPATVIWNPETPNPEDDPADSPNSPEKKQRQVYIRLHPSCFLEVFGILVKLIKRETPRLYIEDLRFEIGSIEVTGPDALEVFKGILRPYHTKVKEKEAHAILFESSAFTSVVLPPDVVLGFSAQDPRLRYPPKTANDSAETATEYTTPADASPAPFLLFDRDARFKSSCFPSQKALNRRKGENPPGQPLNITTADPPFPVVLFASQSSKATQGMWTLLAPWKCILPIWYSLVHYPMSTGGNPRIGGLNELRQVTFEQGRPWFPGDFPGTDAGAEWELEQRQKRKAYWERRPRSKRVSWESLDLGAGRKGEIGLGWACEFENLFGLRQSLDTEHAAIEDLDENAEAERQNKTADPMDIDGNKSGGVSLHHPNIDDIDQAPAAKRPSKRATPHPLTLLNYLSKPAFNRLSISNIKETPPPNSIITIKITFPARGVVEPCARIYRLPQNHKDAALMPATQAEVPATHPPIQQKLLPTALRDQWIAKIPDSSTKKRSASQKKSTNPDRFPPNTEHNTQRLLLAQSLVTKKVPFPYEKNTCENSDHPLVPGEEDLIGYVTKGEFNLAEGKGIAIGSISAEKALEALQTGGTNEGHICVVRNAGETVGWAARWEVV